MQTNFKVSGLPQTERLEDFDIDAQPAAPKHAIDELGLPLLSCEDATFPFEFVNRRCQTRKSTIVTSNKTFRQYGEIFLETALATSLLDRVLRNGTTVSTCGDSYRLAQRKEAGLAEPIAEQPQG